MAFLKRYTDYLKDNPKHYWFKRKLYGWGWTPATREGWLVTAIFLIAIVAIAVRGESLTSSQAVLREVVAPIVFLTLILLYITFKTGEPPRWQWGLPKAEHKNNDE